MNDVVEVVKIPVKDVPLGVHFTYSNESDVSFMRIDEKGFHLQINVLNPIDFEYCLIVCLENYTISYMDVNELVEVVLEGTPQ